MLYLQRREMRIRVRVYVVSGFVALVVTLIAISSSVDATMASDAGSVQIENTNFYLEGYNGNSSFYMVKDLTNG